jgi:mevalonate kinase
MATATAPGKVILFGEHAVVYGYPALAVPIRHLRTIVKVEASSTPGIHLEAPAISLWDTLASLPPDHPLVVIINKVTSEIRAELPPAVKIHIHSTIPVASGLGSGAAMSVALVRALAEFLGRPLSDEKVNALAFEAEKLFHGNPSGIDNTVITYSQPIFFMKGMPFEPVSAGKPFKLLISGTGILAPTREVVADVRRLWEADKSRWEKVFKSIGQMTEKARQAIQLGEEETLGKLMNENHSLLQELTVSCPELDRLVQAARDAGALGAKLSGGGRGGNMIALVQDSSIRKVAYALNDAGAKRLILTDVRS